MAIRSSRGFHSGETLRCTTLGPIIARVDASSSAVARTAPTPASKDDSWKRATFSRTSRTDMSFVATTSCTVTARSWCSRPSAA